MLYEVFFAKNYPRLNEKFHENLVVPNYVSTTVCVMRLCTPSYAVNIYWRFYRFIVDPYSGLANDIRAGTSF